MKLFVYYVGKAKDRNANQMAAEYIKRASRWATVEMREIQPRRTDPAARHPTAIRVALDPAGTAMDSRQFLGLIRDAEERARDLVFLIGGADGLPDGWRESSETLISLTPMTLPHELARVLLAEQIYRAYATLRGHPYPR